MSGELQSLRFAAGERRHWLSETQVVEPNVGKRRQPLRKLGNVGEKQQCLRDGHIEYV